MGTIERRARKKQRARNLQTAALVAVGAVGIIAVAAIAPKLVGLLKTTGINSRLRYGAMRVLSRLKHRGEIEFIEQNGKKYARLTKTGERALELHTQRLALVDGKRRRWDGRYRLVMFDIPERRRGVRAQLRDEMRDIGFLRVQDSAWIFPYDCEEFIALLKADLRLGKDTLYAVVDEMENDAWIRRHFNLPER